MPVGRGGMGYGGTDTGTMAGGGHGGGAGRPTRPHTRPGETVVDWTGELSDQANGGGGDGAGDFYGGAGVPRGGGGGGRSRGGMGYGGEPFVDPRIEYYKHGEWRTLPNGEKRFVPSSGGGNGGAGSRGGGSQSTVATNPNLDWLWDKYKERLGSDDTKQRVQRAQQSIADSAAMLGKDARASLASRGAAGSGVGAAFIQKHITDPALRESAKAASDIELAQQQRLDALVLGGTGLARAGADLALQQGRLSIDQYLAELQSGQQQLQQYSMLANMLGGV